MRDIRSRRSAHANRVSRPHSQATLSQANQGIRLSRPIPPVPGVILDPSTTGGFLHRHHHNHHHTFTPIEASINSSVTGGVVRGTPGVEDQEQHQTGRTTYPAHDRTASTPVFDTIQAPHRMSRIYIPPHPGTLRTHAYPTAPTTAPTPAVPTSPTAAAKGSMYTSYVEHTRLHRKRRQNLFRAVGDSCSLQWRWRWRHATTLKIHCDDNAIVCRPYFDDVVIIWRWRHSMMMAPYNITR